VDKILRLVAQDDNLYGGLAPSSLCHSEAKPKNLNLPNRGRWRGAAATEEARV